MSSETTSHTEGEIDSVDNHLPSGYTAEFDGVSGDSNNRDNNTNEASSQSENGKLNSNGNGTGNGSSRSTSQSKSKSQTKTNTEQESSLKLQGGDMHRDLFKLSAARGRLQQRAATFSHPAPSSFASKHPGTGSPYPTASEQTQPGGFRREHLLRGADTNVVVPGTRNFVEFLDLYGRFAGEDLAESDTDDSEDDEEEQAIGERRVDHSVGAGERRPLLGTRKSTRAARMNKPGEAGTVKTFFTLIKAFVGTGIMFLPKAFSNGGMVFSSITMLAISLASVWAFHLLLKCKEKYGDGYGEMGGIISGKKVKALILASVTLSQLGFVCAGIVFVAENLTSFLNAITPGPTPLSTQALIWIQVAILIPLAFIRNISKLGPAALLADIFILVGLTYIYSSTSHTLLTRGVAPSVVLFNPTSYTLTIGSGIFTFEGVGLLLPIQDSMRSPHKFENLLWLVMGLITLIFTSVGAMCYASFGADTNIEIISNFPQTSRLVNAVQFIYALAVLFGTPVQLFPAMRILEARVFGSRASGKKDAVTKWKKNAFRAALVAACGGVSIAGAGNLDLFVALIGSFACVPLVYIYPAYLHMKGVATKRWVKGLDVLLMAVGVVGMVYTTAVTVKNSF